MYFMLSAEYPEIDNLPFSLTAREAVQPPMALYLIRASHVSTNLDQNIVDPDAVQPLAVTLDATSQSYFELVDPIPPGRFIVLNDCWFLYFCKIFQF